MTRAARGLLRYSVDVWSVAWVQVALLLMLVPFAFELSIPAQIALGVPIFFFRSSCPYIQHNQGHLGTFWARGLNHVYDLELALVTGYVTPLWELQHSRGHHRHYLTPALDPASIVDPKTGRPVSRARYCFVGNLKIVGDALRIAGAEARTGRADLRGKLVAHLALATLLAGGLLAWNWWAFAWFVLLPNVIAGWGVWSASYDHHLDVPGTSHYDGSHTILGRRFNLLTFNIGHHAAHHEKPTLHWSLLPARTARILPLLEPRLVKGTLEPEVRHLTSEVAPTTPASNDAPGAPAELVLG